ncbi:MAG: uracil-DNA glycosylase [bacterium]|nr:uracil-DNA glycosylase [bacterium]
MEHSDNILEQLEQYLQFMKASGVQYLPLAEAGPPHGSPVYDEENRQSTAESEALSTSAYGHALDAMRREFEDCTRCGLSSFRNNVVFGSGDPNADLLFIGIAPGREEDMKGEPFSGAAGDLLTKIIEAIKLRREDVYLSNLIKCCPPDGRDPAKEEIMACRHIFDRQIMAIKPLVICSLGDIAAQSLLYTDESLSSLRGRFHEYNGLPLMPTYHPSYILKNPDIKREVWEDMKQIKKMLHKKS